MGTLNGNIPSPKVVRLAPFYTVPLEALQVILCKSVNPSYGLNTSMSLAVMPDPLNTLRAIASVEASTSSSVWTLLRTLGTFEAWLSI